MIAELKAKPDDISHFREWIGDNETIGDVRANHTTIEILANYSITAVFERKTYNLTIESTLGGEILDPGEGQFVFKGGEEVDLEAVADQGYRFVEWTGDVENIDDITANDTIITIEGNYTVTANFKEKEEPGVEELWDIPGFTIVLLAVGTVTAVAAHYKKKEKY